MNSTIAAHGVQKSQPSPRPIQSVPFSVASASSQQTAKEHYLLCSLEINVWCDRPQRWIWKRFRNGELELIFCRECNTYRTSSSIPLRKCTTLKFVCECLCLLIDRVGAPEA